MNVKAICFPGAPDIELKTVSGKIVYWILVITASAAGLEIWKNLIPVAVKTNAFWVFVFIVNAVLNSAMIESAPSPSFLLKL